MNYNKKYFLICPYNGILDNAKGYSFDLNLRNIMGFMIDKYSSFNLKLESYICRSAQSSSVEDDYLGLHVEGLNFFGGYDSCQYYQSSRLVEIIDFSSVLNNGANKGYTFVSNCNTQKFYISTSNVKLRLFYTRISDNSYFAVADGFSYVFSITGIENKVINPNKNVIIQRLSKMKTIHLTLSTYNAISIDSRNRAYKFSNINLREIIGQEFRYNTKFALITKSYTLCEVDLNYTFAFSGYEVGNILISGFNWVSPSLLYDKLVSSTVALRDEMNKIHPTPACILCQVNYNFSSNLTMARCFKEFYIENVFEISSNNIDIVISNVPYDFYNLILANTSNLTSKFPHYSFQLEIVPLE